MIFLSDMAMSPAGQKLCDKGVHAKLCRIKQMMVGSVCTHEVLTQETFKMIVCSGENGNHFWLYKTLFFKPINICKVRRRLKLYLQLLQWPGVCWVSVVTGNLKGNLLNWFCSILYTWFWTIQSLESEKFVPSWNKKDPNLTWGVSQVDRYTLYID